MLFTCMLAIKLHNCTQHVLVSRIKEEKAVWLSETKHVWCQFHNTEVSVDICLIIVHHSIEVIDVCWPE